jgi:hypothetical protein
MRRILLTGLLLAGCAQLPPTAEDIQAKKFEVLPSKSVIYIVRTPMDSQETSGLSLDGRGQIATFQRTYYRWEVEPGTHRVAGMGWANEEVTLTTAPGKLYFLQHTVLGERRSGAQNTRLKQISEEAGRALVAHSQLLM